MAEDEAGTLAALKAHRAEVFDPEIARRGGRIVKLMGDGVLVEFPSAVDAVECAIAIQTALAGEAGKMRLRIGINLGDIIIDGDDIYSDGVNVAARLEALAEPGALRFRGWYTKDSATGWTLIFPTRASIRSRTSLGNPLHLITDNIWLPRGKAYTVHGYFVAPSGASGRCDNKAIRGSRGRSQSRKGESRVAGAGPNSPARGLYVKWRLAVPCPSDSPSSPRRVQPIS